MNTIQSKAYPWCLLFIFTAVVILSLDDQSYGLRKQRRSQIILDPKTISLKTDADKADAVRLLRNGENEAIAIGINKDTTLISDIVSISHIPSEAMIKIELNENRRCLKPVFRSRLSGPSLAIVKWEEIDLEKHELIGHYNVPYAGKYFFEIISLLCHELEFDQDFKNVCLEDIFHHRVTLDDATIDVVQINQKTGEMLEDTMGSWVYTPANPDEPHVPLHTRIQPDKCMLESAVEFANMRREAHNIPPIVFSPLSDQEAEQCKKYTDTRPFESYHFQWNEPIKEDLLRHSGAIKKICFVGASHSRKLFEAVTDLRGESDSSALRTINFHKQVTESLWHEILNEKECKRIVFGLGQWPASFSGNSPTLFPEFYHDTEILLNDIIAKKELLKRMGADVYLRSMHLCPLMNYVASTCPASDWRSPPVTDGYNSIQRTLCMKYGIPFIDTNFLIGPVWDSAHDWNHLNPDLAVVEGQYIIAQTSLLARNSVMQVRSEALTE